MQDKQAMQAMEPSVVRFLSDKFYDKRKIGALEYVFIAPFHLHLDDATVRTDKP